ncbi:DUF3509 domain-containing protein [Pseudomonas sp. HR96]|uniref:DUF3509 domain-containing protein n=1 Tax=Pseudomonas sp. HR96 TaxID=1027966 RepID=UPI002A74D909|nr:DUF3509 domain-containing protein [Pseudomonas sp. HR96]WPP02303.1 DUF3509 domain-containing protein [Pseudomonas sp. HR96]
MESISQLLSEALTPYQVHVAPCASNGKCRVTLSSASGSPVLARDFHHSQFANPRALVDVVDGLHRDLRVAEGRLEPCMIAALKSAAAGAGFSAALR